MKKIFKLEEDMVKVSVKCTDWKDAVNKALIPLEEKKYITSFYKEAIFKNFKEYGPYMVIAPSIVLLHARPEDGALETALSVMVLENPINFGSDLNDPVKLIFSLSSKDNVSHTNLLTHLMKILMNKDYLNEILNAKCNEDVFKIFNEQ